MRLPPNEPNLNYINCLATSSERRKVSFWCRGCYVLLCFCSNHLCGRYQLVFHCCSQPRPASSYSMTFQVIPPKLSGFPGGRTWRCISIHRHHPNSPQSSAHSMTYSSLGCQDLAIWRSTKLYCVARESDSANTTSFYSSWPKKSAGFSVHQYTHLAACLHLGDGAVSPCCFQGYVIVSC